MRLAALVLALSSLADASVTIYKQAQATMVAPVTGAHNSKLLKPPPPPDPMPETSFFIQLQNAAAGLSVPLPATFMGISIEISVANQALGHNSTFVQVPFLNLMQNLVSRTGAVHVRIGGNTQDFATLVPSLNGLILQKDKTNIQTNNPTATPPMWLSYEMLYLMRNISSFTNVHWFLGIPFNDTNWRLDMAHLAPAILGEYLEGLQVANEPDFYVAHGHRPQGWGPNDYFSEMKQLIGAMGAPEYEAAKSLFVIPSIAESNDWSTQALFDMGLFTQFPNNIKYISVEKYPEDNCAAIYQTGQPVEDPQEMFGKYTSHAMPKSLASRYQPVTAYAHAQNKPFIMFETNTASCGGFPGVSDSFGAALWGLDYALSMGYYNFSGAMFHTGGQNVYYNPFTPAPTNESTYHKWSIGPMYYSMLVMAEIVGSSNKSQILDLGANNDALATPAYAVYQDGAPTKLALFNYMDDSAGGANLTVKFAVGGTGVNEANGTPPSVKVKYLLSPSIADKVNFTWAGQTFGDAYASDGRLTGTEDVQTVNCAGDNTCTVTVPAPGFALVFLKSDVTSESSVQTFSTSVFTKTHNTATLPSEVMATSNGHRNIAALEYSTSEGSIAKNGGDGRRISWIVVTLSMALGAIGVHLRR